MVLKLALLLCLVAISSSAHGLFLDEVSTLNQITHQDITYKVCSCVESRISIPFRIVQVQQTTAEFGPFCLGKLRSKRNKALGTRIEGMEFGDVSVPFGSEEIRKAEQRYVCRRSKCAIF